MNTPIIFNRHLLLSCLVIATALEGCAKTTRYYPNDPWQSMNRSTQSFNDNVDKVVLKPVAKAYEWAVPDVVDKGVSNFFSNINDIGVTVNDLLQFKMKQAGMDGSRFLINTTAGGAGFFDVAKLVNLPKHNEDFGQTLGYWGVPSGSYLVLPFFGPSSPRDTAGLIGDALLNPLTYVSIFGGTAASAATAGAKAVEITDNRADLLSTEKVIDEATVDRYDFFKNSYQQHRKYLINDGNSSSDDDLLLDDESNLEGAGNNNKASTSSTNNGGEGVSGSAPVNTTHHFLNLSTPK